MNQTFTFQVTEDYLCVISANSDHVTPAEQVQSF